MYHTTKPQANTNTTLAAKLAPTIVPRDNASFSPMGGTVDCDSMKYEKDTVLLHDPLPDEVIALTWAE